MRLGSWRVRAKKGLTGPKAYWLKTQLFNFWASYKVVNSESFNFYFLGFWASKKVRCVFLQHTLPGSIGQTLCRLLAGTWVVCI